MASIRMTPDGQFELLSTPPGSIETTGMASATSRSSIETLNSFYESSAGSSGHGTSNIGVNDDAFNHSFQPKPGHATLSAAAEAFKPASRPMYGGNGNPIIVPPTRPFGPAESAFTTEFFGLCTRYVVIHGSNSNTLTIGQIKTKIASLTGGNGYTITFSHPHSGTFKQGNHAYIGFDRLTRAMDFIMNNSLNPLGTREYMALKGYLDAVGMRDTRTHANNFEGQLVLQVMLVDTPAFELIPSAEECYSVALAWLDAAMGGKELRAMGPLGPVHNARGPGYAYRIEVDSLTMASFLLHAKNGDGVLGTNYIGTVEPYYPTGYLPLELRRFDHPRREHRHHEFRATINRENPSINAANAIDMNRILAGLDVRTTVMLRNIPNQMTTYDVESVLRLYVPGAYDFLYLRIDFRNMSNVGYAFVNFASPLDIVVFYQHLRTNGWPETRSRKIGAVSYATIQGTEALVEKFRNSSVMFETPMCRPRLFISQADAHAVAENHGDDSYLGLVGAEVPFPPPNNEAKLQRSRQNAETQGLWPAHSRDEHRRHHSGHFDRGNPHATGPVNFQSGMYPGQPSHHYVPRSNAMSTILTRNRNYGGYTRRTHVHRGPGPSYK